MAGNDAPFPLDSGNGHDEVFPGADCVSDGKWVTFYKVGQEVWACNAVYAAAHFNFAWTSPASSCAARAWPPSTRVTTLVQRRAQFCQQLTRGRRFGFGALGPPPR